MITELAKDMNALKTALTLAEAETIHSPDTARRICDLTRFLWFSCIEAIQYYDNTHIDIEDVNDLFRRSIKITEGTPYEKNISERAKSLAQLFTSGASVVA